MTAMMIGGCWPPRRGAAARRGAARARRQAAVGRFTLLQTLESSAFRDRMRLAEQSGNGGPGQIVDGPSSGLDAAAEHRIHRANAAHRSGRTSIFVSHRLNTVCADRVLVLAGRDA